MSVEVQKLDKVLKRLTLIQYRKVWIIHMKDKHTIDIFKTLFADDLQIVRRKLENFHTKISFKQLPSYMYQQGYDF